MADARLSLAYGAHFGRSDLRRDLPGFTVSKLRPTLHAEDVPLHPHETASLIFVLTGSYETCADGAAQSDAAPMLIFNPAGTTHRDSFIKPIGQFLAISLTDEVTRIAQYESGLPNVPTAFLAGSALAAASRLVDNWLSEPDGDWLCLEDRCWEILGAVAEIRYWKCEAGRSSPPWLLSARELLNDQAGEELSIAEIAQQLDLHPIYLARSFRQHFRCSPAEYRMRCRLQRAMELLQSGQSLSSIALRAGFSDQSHFTTAFRRHFGRTPGQFRKIREIAWTHPDEVPFLQDESAAIPRS